MKFYEVEKFKIYKFIIVIYLNVNDFSHIKKYLENKKRYILAY